MLMIVRTSKESLQSLIITNDLLPDLVNVLGENNLKSIPCIVN